MSDDPTRLRTDPAGQIAPASDEPTRLSDARSPSGWLSSSGAIDHGRFPPGTVLGSRYRIVGRLGRGGMGEVYRADDLKLGQPVALKFLPPDVDRDPARLTQLHTEVRMARQVSHPSVCRVYDIDEVEGHTFLSMEYVDGEDLASLLRRIGRFPEERGLEIARQLCAGLAAAHERGVVHRDLKPANVMIDGTGRARITDFGLAGITGESLRAGTPAYMAPEQLAGNQVTALSDIYALGLVLYEIFTGKRALEGDNLADLIRSREQGEIAPPSALTSGLSPEIDRAVMRCLLAEPTARPRSALAVAAALPGGDPLAAALAAGETPSPEMVAAAGESGGLSRLAGVALLGFVIAGLMGIASAADRVLLVNRVSLTRSADVLEARAREIMELAGYSDPPTDTARGATVTTEHATWVARQAGSPLRWGALSTGDARVLRFWYRTSPRPLVPVSISWTPQVNDPPLAVSGMVTVVVDERGRLVELVSMPPQLDTSEPGGAAVDWRKLFDAAGLPLSDFTEVAPQWTPRVYADQRIAWEGPMPGANADVKLRVEAAAYRGRSVSFQMVWPWSRPMRMEQEPPSSRERVLSAAGTVFVLSLMAGAIALVRYNMKSGRADRRGAARVSLFLIGVWLASWILGARHFFELEEETNRFFHFLSFALSNVGATWLFYLALEPFVRRLSPEMLIGWTRLLAGQLRDTRVGRDLLIGVALGVFIAILSTTAPLGFARASGSEVYPQTSNVNYLLGFRYTLSAILRFIPNALQTAMLGTFAYVVMLAIVRRRWIATALILALLGAVIVGESGDEPVWTALLFAALVGAPTMYVFQRYGLLPVATGLLTNFWIKTVPFTTDPARPHAEDTFFVVLLLSAAAAYAFHISRAGEGMFRRLLPPA